jgi:hypothetical protein
MLLVIDALLIFYDEILLEIGNELNLLGVKLRHRDAF